MSADVEFLETHTFFFRGQDRKSEQLERMKWIDGPRSKDEIWKC